YITSVERIGMQRGFEQGIQQGIQQGMQQGMQQAMQQARMDVLAGIELGLELRFGINGLALLPDVSKIQDVERLRFLRSALRAVPTLDDWLRLLSTPPQTDMAH
ncbi:MAG: hypothetical protein WA029_24235, partial [Anaerolineae bacterium]